MSTEENNMIVKVDDSTELMSCFSKESGLDPYIEEAKRKVAEFEPDITTAKGRKAIASLSSNVSKTKTFIDKMGKALTEDWKAKAKIVDASRKKMRDEFDALRDLARKPLTEWEQAEEKRVKKLEYMIFNLKSFSNPIVGKDESLANYKDIAQQLDTMEIGEEYEERKIEAIDLKYQAIAFVEKKILEFEKIEAERAELQKLRDEAEARKKADDEERLRKEGEERAKAEAEKKIAEEKAKAEAEADAKKRKAEEAELAALRAKSEAEARAKAAEEARAKAEQDAEAARIKAEHDAEVARIKAEQDAEAARIKAEHDAEAARIKAEADKVKAKEEAEAALERERAESLLREKAAEEKSKKDAADKLEAEEKARKEREANIAHNTKIKTEAKECLIAEGMTEEMAIIAVKAIVSNKVKHVSIRY